MFNLFFVTTNVVQSFVLNCSSKIGNWSVFKEQIEYCDAQNVNIISANEQITSVNGQTEPTIFQGIFIKDQTVHYLPKGIDKFFQNLKALTVHTSELKSMTQDDLKPLTQLEIVGFPYNNLKSLDGDLFKFNPKLIAVDFMSNNLTYVGDHLMRNLTKLQGSYFKSNPCINININAQSKSEFFALEKKLKSQCQRSPNSVDIEINEQLKEENPDFKDKIKQTNIEMCPEKCNQCLLSCKEYLKGLP